MRTVFRSAFILAIVLVPSLASASNILLTVVADQVAKTWTVMAQLSDQQNLGLIAFSLDVKVSNLDSSTPTDLRLLRAATASQTNQSPTAFFTTRSIGTISGPNILDINGIQPVINAVNNLDDS